MIRLTENEINITKSDGSKISLYPLDIYLNYAIFDYMVLVRDDVPNGELYSKLHKSLTLVNYKPMVTYLVEISPSYMQFMLEVSISPRGYSIGYPTSIEVRCGEKTIPLNLGDLSRVIEAYDYKIYKRTVYVTIIQGATVKDFVLNMIELSYKDSIDSRFWNMNEFAKKKIEPLIQTLQSANQTIREHFRIEHKFYYYHNLLIPRIFLFPREIVNEISDFLLSLYEQNYGIVAKFPPEFTPNENVQSEELKKFFDRLPLELVGKAVVGTYGSSPAVLLPKGDYSQYLTGNERVFNLEDKAVIVFGNLQQTPTPQQQNVEQNEEGENNTDLNKLEKVSSKIIAERLDKEIRSIYESIIKDNTVNVEEKKHRLETLNNDLYQLGKTILDTLKSQTPLNSAEDIAKHAGFLYTDNFDYYLNYYEHLSETEKLELLTTLLISTVKTMYDINKRIKEYNSQQLAY